MDVVFFQAFNNREIKITLDEKFPTNFLTELRSPTNYELSSICDNHIPNSPLRKKQRPKILIVDDNEILLKMLNKMLTDLMLLIKEEFEIISANDGLDILNYVLEDQFNGNLIKCIITDENMEFINGSEAVSLLLKMQRRNKIKEISVIFLTGLDQGYNRQFLKDFENCQFLSKPISTKELEKKLIEINVISADD